MAQLDGMRHRGDSSRTAEQLFNTDSPSVSNIQRTSEGRILDEERFQTSRKISVIAKVKEKAKKWRQNLSRKKHGHDNTPSWGIGDEIEEDIELHGGSSARHRMFGRSSINRSGKNNTKKSSSERTLAKSCSDIQRGNPSIPNITINDSFRAKSLDRNHSGRAPSPINYKVEHIVTEKNAGILREKLLHLQAMRESEPEEIDEHHSDITPPLTTLNKEMNEGIERDIDGEEQVSPTTMKSITEAVKGRVASSKVQDMGMKRFDCVREEGNYEKGVSVKECLRNKVEPEEDERALLEVNYEVISPRTTSEKGVVEKVRDVSLMVRSEESPSLSSIKKSESKKSESTSSIPMSNIHEVEEESHGRILQAN